MSGLSIPASAMRSLSERMAVSAANVANAFTTGFSRGRVEFSSVSGGGVRAGGHALDLAPGFESAAFSEKAIPVIGDGRFVIDTPVGPAFARAEDFSVDQRGTLVSKHGFVLAPGIKVPPGTSSITIAPDGTVQVELIGGRTQEVGRIEVIRVTGAEASPEVSNPAASAIEFESATFQTAMPRNIAQPAPAQATGIDYVDEAVDQLITRIAFSANAAAFSVRAESERFLISEVA
ncbi:MAG: flagellar basal body protein [Planctomycetes bacterium]|nr:flagellar basal body protein [Planctomycetota bacterium]